MKLTKDLCNLNETHEHNLT